MVLKMGNGASDEDVMEEIEQYLHEYKLWEKKNHACVFLSQKKALLHKFKMFPSFARPIHHFHACVPISCQKK